MPGIELTTLSELEYGRLNSSQMTPAMAGEYLREGRIVLRNLEHFGVLHLRAYTYFSKYLRACLKTFDKM